MSIVAVPETIATFAAVRWPPLTSASMLMICCPPRGVVPIKAIVSFPSAALPSAATIAPEAICNALIGTPLKLVPLGYVPLAAAVADVSFCANAEPANARMAIRRKVSFFIVGSFNGRFAL